MCCLTLLANVLKEKREQMQSSVKCSIVTSKGVFKGPSIVSALSKAYEKIFGVPADIADPTLNKAYWAWFWSDEDHIKAVTLDW